MDRGIVYDLEQIRPFDFLNSLKEIVIALGRITQSVLGSSTTVVSGFSRSQTTVPSMTIDIAEGRIFQVRALDGSAYGALDEDSRLVFQHGYKAAHQLTFSVADLTAGQSKWALVEATWAQVDAVHPDDPTDGVLPFFNPQNPLLPFQGPGGQGGVLPTVRQGAAQVNIVYGTPATTGSHVPPSPSGNAVPLYLIELVFGQTSITTGQVLVAGPEAYPNYQRAPFLTGLMQSHHGGIAGQGPKVKLGNAEEVQGVLPMANLPASSTNGSLSAFRQGNGNPNGTLAGTVGDSYFQQDASTYWVCTTTGSAATAVWQSVGSSPPVVLVNTFPFTPTQLYATYLFDTSGGGGTVNLPAIASAPNAQMTFKKITDDANEVVLDPNGGELIENEDYNAQATYGLFRKNPLTYAPKGNTWRIVG